ncbi:hypothetical protein ACDN41_11955 [Priestia aryabhattai]|uniref:hypothetical protein n=1 Tax=Priestia aryabhattai TaxID=412384 RepID=UPI00353259B6
MLNEYDNESLAEMCWNLNRYRWDERLGEKPKDWDSLPDYDLSKNLNIKTKHEIVSKYIEAIKEKIGEKEYFRWHHKNNIGKTDSQFEKWWMDELRRKKDQKNESVNREVLMDILNFIENKNKIKCEEFTMNSLQSIERFKREINERYTDSILVLSDDPEDKTSSNYTTVFKVENKDNLAEAIHDLVYELFDGEYKVKINILSKPTILSFYSDECNKVYHLMNYDEGTIVV